MFRITTGCGFESPAGQLEIAKSFGWDLRPKSRVTALYPEHVKKPGGIVNGFVLYPSTIPHNN